MDKTEFRGIWRRSVYYRSRGGKAAKVAFISDFLLCDEITAASLIPYFDE